MQMVQQRRLFGALGFSLVLVAVLGVRAEASHNALSGRE